MAKDEVLEVYKITSSCKANITNRDNCKMDLVGVPGNCLKVVDLISKVLAKNSKVVSEILSSIPASVSLESAEVDRCAKTFKAEIAAEADYEIVKGLVTLTDVHFLILVGTQPSKLDFNVSGSWNLGDIEFRVSVAKSAKGVAISGSIPALKKISVANIIHSFGNSMVSKVQRALSKIGFGNIIVSNVSLKSNFESTGSEMQLSFIVDDPKLGNPKVYLTVYKLTNGFSGVTVGCYFGNLQLSYLLERLIKVDISGVPIIGKVRFNNVGLLLSTFSSEQLFISYEDPTLKLLQIKQGLQLVTDVKFSSQSQPAKVKLTINPPLVGFRILGDSGISIGAFIDLLIKHFGNIMLPPKFSLEKVLKLHLVSFDYDSKTKNFTIPVELSDRIILIPKAIELQKAKIIFKIQKIPPKTGFDIQSTWKLGPLTIPLNISKPKGLPVFLAESRPQFEISFGNMIKQFLVGILPSGPLENAVKKVGFVGFSVKNPYFQIYFATDVAVKLSGTAVIGAWDKCQVEIMIGKVGGASAMATGIVLKGVPITTLIHKVTKIDLSKIPGATILDNTDVAIAMASQNIPKGQDFMHFSIPALRDVDILDGVFLVTSFKFPEDCRSDIGCKVFKRLLGSNLQLVLKGRLFVSNAYISATVPTEIQLFKIVNITDIGFEFEAGLTRSSVAITGTLKLRKPPLTFKGSFGISTSGVFLQMSMKGLWNKPFGIPILAVGDLHFRIAIGPSPILISVLEIGGRAMIGDIGNSNAKPINVSTYIGIDLVSPIESYFYGSVSPLTLPSILKAFGYTVSLPKPFAEIGFPKGLNVSHSFKSKVLPNGVTIIRGFYIQGMIKVLFFEVYSDVKLDFNGVMINMYVGPFSIGNDLIAIKGRSDTVGPRILVDVGWNPPRALINVEGTIKVLGIQFTTNITISTKGASFYVHGSLLNLAEAELHLKTQTFSLKSADFHVTGTFRQSFVQKLNDAVEKILNNYKDAADKAIRKVQERINDAKKAFDKAADKVASLKSKVDSQKAICDSAVKTLESKKRFFEDKKKIFDSAANKLKSARDNLSRKQQSYKDAVNKHADKLRKGCPGNCRKSESDTFKNAYIKIISLIY